MPQNAGLISATQPPHRPVLKDRKNRDDSAEKQKEIAWVKFYNKTTEIQSKARDREPLILISPKLIAIIISIPVHVSHHAIARHIHRIKFPFNCIAVMIIIQA